MINLHLRQYFPRIANSGGHRFAALAAGLGLTMVLAGCAGGGAARTASYPNINAVPPPSQIRLLTPAEQAAVAAALKAKAARARIQADRRAAAEERRKMAELERRAKTHGADAVAEIKGRCRETAESTQPVNCPP